MLTRSHTFSTLAACAALVAVAACGGEKEEHATSAPSAAPPPSAAVADVTPCATCKIITVNLITTEKGNYFEPKNFEAHEGDVIRFTLKVGVHNVNFLADSNPGKQNLPKMSDMLQLPGQTHDVKLNFGTGRFYFQCDPHALLGMTGHVKVEKQEGEK
jgi:plastocyanin